MFRRQTSYQRHVARFGRMAALAIDELCSKIRNEVLDQDLREDTISKQTAKYPGNRRFCGDASSRPA